MGVSETLSLQAFLPYRLSLLSNRISGAMAEIYARKFDITVPEWRVLAIVGEEGGISALDVVIRSAMDKVAVSRAVKRLIDAGRLRREFAKDDRRRSELFLSNAGQEVYQQIVPIALSYETAILNQLTDAEQTMLDAMLTRLINLEIALPVPD